MGIGADGTSVCWEGGAVRVYSHQVTIIRTRQSCHVCQLVSFVTVTSFNI